jgi:HNH endonuclease
MAKTIKPRLKFKRVGTLEEKLLLRMMPVTETGCWIWLGTLDRDGYAQMDHNGKAERAQRLSYEHFIGPIPDGLVLDHLCRVRCCINPHHLEPVTDYENVRRGECWTWGKTRTHCKYGHLLDEDNTHVNRLGTKCCRTCWRIKRRRYLAQKRATESAAPVGGLASLGMAEPSD